MLIKWCSERFKNFNLTRLIMWLYTIVFVNIGSGNGLLPDGTKPLPTPMLTYHWWGTCICRILFKTQSFLFNYIHLNMSCVKLRSFYLGLDMPHWGRVTHTCVSKIAIIGSVNGLSPDRRQAIILTNAGILSIGPLGRNSRDILIEIHTFSFKKIYLKIPSGKWWPICLGPILLIRQSGAPSHNQFFLFNPSLILVHTGVSLIPVDKTIIVISVGRGITLIAVAMVPPSNTAAILLETLIFGAKPTMCDNILQIKQR